jgi:hypothetical protein
MASTESPLGFLPLLWLNVVPIQHHQLCKQDEQQTAIFFIVSTESRPFLRRSRDRGVKSESKILELWDSSGEMSERCERVEGGLEED